MADPFTAAQNLFQLPKSYAQVSDFFPPSGEDSAYINQIEERPNTPPQTFQGIDPRMMVAAAQAGIDPMGVADMARKIQADIQGQRLIRSIGDIDFSEKDSNDKIAKLLSRNPLGVQLPGVQHVLNLKSLAAKQGKDTQYDEEVGNAVKGLSTLGTSEEDVNKANDIINSLSPGAALKAAPLITGHQRNVSALQSKRTADQDEKKLLERTAIKIGLDTSKYDNNDDLKEAISDKMLPMQQHKEFVDFMQKNPEFRKDFFDARKQLRSGPSDDDKMAAVGVSDEKKMTPELWRKGYNLALPAIIDRVRGIQDEMSFLGIALPSATPQSTNPTASPATPQPTIAGVPPIVATTPPPASVAPPIATPVPVTPTSLADIPSREERDRAKEIEAKNANIAADEGIAKAVEERLISQYQQPGKKIEDLVDKVDSMAAEYQSALDSQSSSVIDSFSNKQKKFLMDHGLTGSPNEIKALDKLLLSRRTPNAGATSTGKRFTVGTPRKVD